MIAEGVFLGAIGIGLGLAAATALTRSVGSMFVGVRANDPMTFATAAIFFLGIATLASFLPAWRAAGLAPWAALRQE